MLYFVYLMKKPYFLLLISCLIPFWPGVAGAESKVVRADSHALIVPVLELTVSQQGARELSFGDISPSSLGPTETTPKIIAIEVHCNSGEKYQVTQALGGDLENAAGDKLSSKNLKFKTVSGKSTGQAVPDFTPVEQGTQTIFISDEQGTSETLSAQYRLTVPPSQAPGDYSALLTYTVSSV